MIEWSAWQQIWFLIVCIPCGVILGFLFELTSVFVRFSTKKPAKYIYDAIYGVLAAVVTFFAALVIMDGQLHPVLFIGLCLGFLSEHIILGKFVMRIVGYSVRIAGKSKRFLWESFVRILGVLGAFCHYIHRVFGTNLKIAKKNS